jgi:hypothetical protein
MFVEMVDVCAENMRRRACLILIVRIVGMQKEIIMGIRII